jgi:hypothetical protein
VYAVKVTLEGFQALERPGVIISVGSNVKVDFQLKVSPVEEEVTVVAPSPVVDVKSSTQSSIVTSDLIQNLPVARDVLYLSVTAPSVIDGGNSMISTHGATLQQSRYVLDGVDITDPMHGYRSTEIAFDAVEEVEMGLSGLGADIAKTAAGYINVVTKSGGNRFSGSITGVYAAEDLTRSLISEKQLKAMGVGVPIFDKFSYDTSLTLGGPIVRDRLWFFLNPRYTDFKRATNFIPFTNAIGVSYGPFDRSRQELTGLAKLTAQISKKMRFMTMLQYYNVADEPAPDWMGPRRTWTSSAATLNDSYNLSNVLSYVLDQNTFVDARVGYGQRHLQQQDFYERGKWELEPFAYDRQFGTTWGLLSWNEDHRRKNLDLNLAVTRYQGGFLGANHEIKVGMDYTWWNVKTSHFSEYPYETYWYNNTPWYYHDTSPYLGAFYVTNEGPEWNSNSQLNLGTRFGVYLQDAISFGRLTLNLGVRFDSSHYTRPEEIRKGWADVNNNGLANILLPDIFPTTDTIAPEMKDLVVWNILQPRVGLTFDLFGDGTTALKATYSRYAENLIASMMRGIHPFDPWVGGVTFLWYDNNQNGLRDLPPVDDYFPTSIPKINTDPGSLTNWMDPDLKAPYIDELTVGVEREIIKDFKLELRGIYRNMRNIPELTDTANPLDGDMWMPYTVTDPGGDGLFGTGDEQQLTVFALRKDAAAPNRYLTTIEELRRKYWGVELVMFKRMSNNWQFSGSVTYSRTYGNIGGGFTDSRMNLGTFMNPNNLINLWGRTNFDRPLMIKLMGTVILPFRIHMSAYFRHFDGSNVARTLTVYFPGTVGGYATKVPSVTVRAEPLGSIRYPGEDIVDFRLEKQFFLGFGNLGLFMDVFNLLGYTNIYPNINSGGYIFANGSFQRFPQYGRYDSVSATRSLQFTVRLQF